MSENKGKFKALDDQDFIISSSSNSNTNNAADLYHPLYTVPSQNSMMMLYDEDEYASKNNNNNRKRQKSRQSPTRDSSSNSTPHRRPRKQPHELLTESQKKANHIASEQKRRQNIRVGFDQLIDIVPSLNQGNRSEALILQKSVDHIRYLLSVKTELKSRVRDLQGALGDTNYEGDSSEDELVYHH